MAGLVRLAQKQLGNTVPNPVVAAAVVKDGRVISRAAHQKAGGPHAEVRAIRPVFDQCKGATLFVTLEPCTHFGRTPPCTDIIVAAGIRKVVYAVDDPNPVVRGRTAKTVLGAHGIEVESGLCETLAREANRVYFKNRLTHRPFVTLKAAVTLDGRVALENGQSKYITSSAALTRVHRLRAEHQAVLVGVGTVLADDPSLNIRLPNRQPKPNIVIVLDPNLRTPPTAKLFSDRSPDQVWVVTRQTPTAELKNLATFLTVSDNPFNLDAVLAALYSHGICSILIEGGSGTYTEFVSQHAIDCAHFFIAPKLMVGAKSIPVLAAKRSLTTLGQLPHILSPNIRAWGPDVEVSGPVSF